MLDARSCRPGEVIHLAGNTRAAVAVAIAIVVCDSNLGEKPKRASASRGDNFVRPNKIIDKLQSVEQSGRASDNE